MTQDQAKLREEHLLFLKQIKKKKSKLKRRENWTALAFISVKYLGLIIFTVIPVLFALLYSFMDYQGGYTLPRFFNSIPKLWGWFDNYKLLFTDINYADVFFNAIGNNIILMLSVPLGIFIGLVLGYILSRDSIRGSKVFRTLIYVPVVSSAVAMNYIWRYIFAYDYGIIHVITGWDIKWLSNEHWVKVAMIIKAAWGSLGRTMILCLAALTNVGRDYYEAADLDGAGEITKFVKISVPLITPTIFYLLCTGIIGNLQQFVDSQIFAAGNDGGETIVYFIWEYGIGSAEYGIASAASFVLTIGIMIITFVQFKIQDKWVYSE